MSIGESGEFHFDPHGDTFRMDAMTSSGLFAASAPLSITSDTNPTGV